MKKIITLFFLLLIVFSGAAQKLRQARIDSLLPELPRQNEDTLKLKLYLDIINTYNDFNQNEALAYEEPALHLANKLNLKSGVGDIKNAIGRVYWRKGKFEKARAYHIEAKEIFELAGDLPKIARAVRFIGQDYADEGNYLEALKNFETSLSMYTQLKDIKRMGYIYSLIQWTYQKLGDYPNATKAGFASLKLFESINDEYDRANALSSIAEDYLNMGNYPFALRYFTDGLDICRAKGDCTCVGYNYNLIGVAYMRAGNYAQSQKNHSAALAVGQHTNDYIIIANAYEGIAEVYKAHHDYPQTLTNYKFAAEGFKACRNKRDQSRVYCAIGECYRIIKQYDKAKKYFDEALALSLEMESKIVIADYYRGVERLDSAKGDWQGAYANYKKYAAMRDSTFNQENIKKLVQMEMMHEFDKKEASAKTEQERKDFEQRIGLISLSIISFLILVLAIVLYRSRKRMAHVNTELKHKSEKLEEENREKNSILNIVSHDLKAPFNKIKGLTDLIVLSRNGNHEYADEYITHIRNSIDQGNYLIANLLEAQSVESSSNKLSRERVDLWSFVSDFQMSINGQLLKKQQKLLVDVDDGGSTLTTDKQMLTRVLDNLLSNASKFSEKGKTIFLRVWSDQAQIHFSVRDQGPGISAEDQKKMFKKFQRLSARPTAGEGSTGLGLSITRVLVEKLNGSIQVESALNKGTEFIISLWAD